MGLTDGILGDKLMNEVEKRMRLITNELCPRMDSLIIEQRITNQRLDKIIALLDKISLK